MSVDLLQKTKINQMFKKINAQTSEGGEIYATECSSINLPSEALYDDYKVVDMNTGKELHFSGVLYSKCIYISNPCVQCGVVHVDEYNLTKLLADDIKPSTTSDIADRMPQQNGNFCSQVQQVYKITDAFMFYSFSDYRSWYYGSKTPLTSKKKVHCIAHCRGETKFFMLKNDGMVYLIKPVKGHDNDSELPTCTPGLDGDKSMIETLASIDSLPANLMTDFSTVPSELFSCETTSTVYNVVINTTVEKIVTRKNTITGHEEVLSVDKIEPNYHITNSRVPGGNVTNVQLWSNKNEPVRSLREHDGELPVGISPGTLPSPLPMVKTFTKNEETKIKWRNSTKQEKQDDVAERLVVQKCIGRPNEPRLILDKKPLFVTDCFFLYAPEDYQPFLISTLFDAPKTIAAGGFDPPTSEL